MLRSNVSNILRKGDDGASATWTAGVTESAIRADYDAFSAQIDATIDAINAYAPVDAALAAGWSGTDCQDYLDKFHTHASEVIAEIETYRTAVQAEVESIIENWTSFQENLIS